MVFFLSFIRNAFTLLIDFFLLQTEAFACLLTVRIEFAFLRNSERSGVESQSDITFLQQSNNFSI